MKTLSLLLISVAIFTGCSKNYGYMAPAGDNCCNITTRYDSAGSILFYTTDPQMMNTCGSVKVKMSTGEETTIYGHHPNSPNGTESNVGGLIWLNPGHYSFSVITSRGCEIAGGEVEVLLKTSISVELK